MKKDVIYIDIEDDITSIIGKVTDSSAAIVAVVPPKRSTVLNSAVNMKLLQKAAEDSNKRVVLVTGEKSLLGLASGVGMYVTHNLHSKPEVPKKESMATHAEDDIIEGSELDETASIGELAGVHSALSTAKNGTKATLADSTDEVKDAGAKKPKKSFKIPSFDAFRTKLIVIGLAVLLLAGGWWWAFMVAPRATVAINAQTSKIDVEFELIADANVDERDAQKQIFPAKKVTLERVMTESFTPSGKKNVGDKASGQMTIQNCDSSESFTVDAGTLFTDPSGLKFESLAEAAVPGGAFSNGGQDCTPGEATITVRALAPGAEYNLGVSTIYDIDGLNSNVVGFGGQMSGGTDKNVTIVAQKDIDAATKKLKDKEPSDVLGELKEDLGPDFIAINESYVISAGTVTAQPKVGDEASSGTVSSKVVFTLLGIARSDMKSAVEEVVQKQTEGGSQNLYRDGLDDVRFELNKKTNADTLELTVVTAAYVGPTIDASTLAQDISGKRFSEVKKIVEDKPGVVSVNVDFQPFWVFTAPSPSKISIEFSIQDSINQ